MPRWAPGFREKIEAITGEREFTYCLAVTRLHGDASARCLLMADRAAAPIVIVAAEREPALDDCGRDGLEYVHD